MPRVEGFGDRTRWRRSTLSILSPAAPWRKAARIRLVEGDAATLRLLELHATEMAPAIVSEATTIRGGARH